MKCILITGGSGKVGIQLVNHFLEKDFLVVTTTRNKERFLNSKKDQLHQNHTQNLQIVEVDFTAKNAAPTIINFLRSKNIQVENLVHNARSLDYIKIEKDFSVTEENFSGELFVNVVFPYKLTMDLLQEQKSLANIVFISSMYGVVAPTPSLYNDFHSSSPIHYGVSKAAQIHLTKELAVRLAPKVRVNCVSFGGIKGRTDEAFQERYNKLTPLQSMLTDEDVKGPVDFLISENSKNMTGQNLMVDGGWSIW